MRGILRPLQSTYAPRDDPIHDFRTGVVKYWVDVTPEFIDSRMSIPLLGDYLTGLVVENVSTGDFIKFSIYDSNQHIADCETKWSIDYANVIRMMDVRVHLRVPICSPIIIRAEFILLKNEPIV